MRQTSISLPLLFGIYASASPAPKSLRARQNELGTKPALGWNGWNAGGCNAADADTALRMAQAFIDLGLKDLGYEYVNIDDCWTLLERDGDGNLVPDPDKWPNGVKAVADEIHALGLKFGLYGDAGYKTCAGYPGSEGHEQQDADLLASFGVDYWKHDNCYTPCNVGPPNDHTCPDPAGHTREWYEIMKDALAATGAPIFYSLCNWGRDEVWTWGAEVGQSWRMSVDNWGGWEDVVSIASFAAGISEYSKPGGFNDLDMMIIGNGGLTLAEERTHFALWAISKSPIIQGTDLTKLGAESLEIIKNKVLQALIDINQDDLGVAATYFQPSGAPAPVDGEIYPYWAGPLSDGHVVALVAASGAQQLFVNLSDVPGLENGDYSWTEVHSGETGTGTSVSAELGEHDIAVFKITSA